MCNKKVQKSKRTYRLEHFLFDNFNNKTHSHILCLTTTQKHLDASPRCLSHQQGVFLIVFISYFLIELTQQCLPPSFTITKAKRVSHILNKWTYVVNCFSSSTKLNILCRILHWVCAKLKQRWCVESNVGWFFILWRMFNFGSKK